MALLGEARSVDERVFALAGALGGFYQALSKETVLGMTDAEVRAYMRLQDAAQRLGLMGSRLLDQDVECVDELSPVRSIPKEDDRGITG